MPANLLRRREGSYWRSAMNLYKLHSFCLQLTFLASFLPTGTSVHLDIDSHCKKVVENEWTLYDCQFYSEPLTLDQSTARSLRIENAMNMTINLEFLPDLEILDIKNVSQVNIFHDSQKSASLTQLKVLHGENVIAYLESIESLESVHISNIKVQNITFPKNLHKVVLQNVELDSTIISTLSGEFLELLDISENPLSEASFLDMPKLTFLSLAKTNLATFPNSNFPSLTQLDLSGSKIVELRSDDFNQIPNLEELVISQMPELQRIEQGVFAKLEKLNKVSLTDNPRLETLPEFQFPKSLKYLNISGNSLKSIPKTIKTLDLDYFSAKGNNIICDCRSFWLYHWSREPLLCGEGVHSGLKLSEALPQENCSIVELENSTGVLVTHIHNNITLSCSFKGNPVPSITWITPRNKIFKWDPEDENRIQVLHNGDLHIQKVERSDIGRYTCTGSNPVSDFTTYVTVRMDPSDIHDMKIISILFGLATCVGFLLIVVTVLLIKLTIERCGWRCCRKRESPQAKRVKTMLENLEQYRSQQLERLRENYHQQVNRIKDNCSQQVERIRDAYQHQAQNVRDLKSYGTHHFSTIRDQYNEQIKRVSDYSTDRLGRVRTNYVTQRDRISRFSAQQLLRIRESAKFQQRTLNKIIENLPSLYLDNCRTGGPGTRTDSIYFDDDFTEVDMYIQTTISRISQEFDNFNREAIALETIDEEKDGLQIVEEVVAKQPRTSRQGSGTSIDLSKFLPSRLTTAANNARKNRRRKRPKNQKHVSVTVERCEVEAHEALLPQPEEVQPQCETLTVNVPDEEQAQETTSATEDLDHITNETKKEAEEEQQETRQTDTEILCSAESQPGFIPISECSNSTK